MKIQIGTADVHVRDIKCSDRNLDEILQEIEQSLLSAFGDISIYRQNEEREFDVDPLLTLEDVEVELCKIQELVKLIK